MSHGRLGHSFFVLEVCSPTGYNGLKLPRRCTVNSQDLRVKFQNNHIKNGCSSSILGPQQNGNCRPVSRLVWWCKQSYKAAETSNGQPLMKSRVRWRNAQGRWHKAAHPEVCDPTSCECLVTSIPKRKEICFL